MVSASALVFGEHVILAGMAHLAAIGLGSNLGEREHNLETAMAFLAPLVKVTGRSPIYETEPWGFSEQPDFLNMAVIAETGLEPAELIGFLNEIEQKMGRERTVRYGPRSIDLDLLLFDDLVLDLPGLTIPHPHLHERAFVLVPLADLAPDWIHPVLKVSMRALLDPLDSSGVRPAGV